MADKMKCIGYIPTNADGTPEIKQLRERSNPRPKPITVYKTAALAQRYSDSDMCKAIFVKED